LHSWSQDPTLADALFDRLLRQAYKLALGRFAQRATPAPHLSRQPSLTNSTHWQHKQY
jgi:hypothetical protein